MEIDKIAATLEDGRILSRDFKIFLKIGIACCVIGYLLSVIIIATGLYPNDINVWFLGVFVFLFCFGIGGAFFYLIWRNKKIELKVQEYLIDAEELYAETRIVNDLGIVGRIQDGVKIEIRFQLNNRKYVRISGNPNKKTLRNGYDKVFLMYANRIVRILYSPKYDQIMILKDK